MVRRRGDGEGWIWEEATTCRGLGLGGAVRLGYGLGGGAYGEGPIGDLYLGGGCVLDWKTLFGGGPKTWGGDKVEWWVKIGLLVV